MKAHQSSAMRESVLQYLYLCETRKFYFFSPGQWRDFLANFRFPKFSKRKAQLYARSILNSLKEIDSYISGYLIDWKVERLQTNDLNVLRIAVYEFKNTTLPKKVVLNEAINMARKYGDEHSFKFVNGILDSVSRSMKNS